MIFLWIIILFLLIINWYLIYQFLKIKKINKELLNEVIEDKKKPIMLGKVSAFTNKDLKLIKENPTILDILIKIFEYKIAKKNDEVRREKWMENINQRIWELNNLYDIHLFFYKIKTNEIK